MKLSAMTEALKVLIIEDYPDVALGCEQALQLEGIAAECVGSAEQARRRLEHDFRGIVISDIRLPKMDGMNFLREILAIDPELPVILITGHGDISMAVQAMTAGANSCSSWKIRFFSVLGSSTGTSDTRYRHSSLNR